MNRYHDTPCRNAGRAEGGLFMKLYQILLPVLIGALIGYCTNYIAIKMLFLPRRALHIGKWRLPMTPGVIPKNKARLATAVGNAVSDRLITQQDILEGIERSGVQERIVDGLTASIVGSDASIRSLTDGAIPAEELDAALDRASTLLGQKILDGIQSIDLRAMISDMLQTSFGTLLANPMVAMFLGSISTDSISERIVQAIHGYIDEHGLEKAAPMVRRELEKLLNLPLRDGLAQLHVDADCIRRMLTNVVDRLISDHAADLIGCIDVRSIVEAKINAMDVRELEELVLSVMKNELQTVVNLGAVIGAIIGAVNIFI